MTYRGAKLDGIEILEPQVNGDRRGFFVELFNAARRNVPGLSLPGRDMDGSAIVQINHSHSKKGTLRGLHFQEPRAQGKLVWVVTGVVFDVAVDVRKGSDTFGRWMGVELSAENHRQLWIPPGFAHGFCVTSDQADFLYACTDVYVPECEHSVRWDDPAIGVEWPVDAPVVSDKDRNAPTLADAPVLPVVGDAV